MDMDQKVQNLVSMFNTSRLMISLECGTKFDHVTPYVLQKFKVKWQRSRSQR